MNTEKKRKKLAEISTIRAISCISIVLLHSIKMEIGFSYNGNNLFDLILMNIAGLLSFGTASFVVISEVLIAYNYKNRLPKKFFLNKIKYVIIPFIVMAIFYGVFRGIGTIPERILINFIGGYHGWFVLVVFQFYVLHMLFSRFLSNIKPLFVILVSFVISITYLCYFNFFPQISNGPIYDFIWDRGYWVPFIGWFFYFTIAYYIGKNYFMFMKYIKKKKVWISSGVFFSAIIIILNNQWLDLGYGSKRFDMVIFTTFIILFFLRYLEDKRNIFLDLISRYSFGIYLIHYFYLIVIYKILDTFSLDLGHITIIIAFIGGIAASIITTYVINSFPYGEYIIGKVNLKIKLKFKTKFNQSA